MAEPMSLVNKAKQEVIDALLGAAKTAVFIMANNQVKMIQSRVSTDELLIEEYTQVLMDGGELPPGVAIFDKDTGRVFWLMASTGPRHTSKLATMAFR